MAKQPARWGPCKSCKEELKPEPRKAISWQSARNNPGVVPFEERAGGNNTMLPRIRCKIEHTKVQSTSPRSGPVHD